MAAKNTLSRLFLTVALLVCTVSTALAVPRVINFQGYLTDAGGTPLKGVVVVTFSIYDVANGGAALWSETVDVSVDDGAYSVDLGEATALSLPFDVPYFLGVKVGADAEMSPRLALTSVPYAITAGSADIAEDVADGAIVSSKLAPGAITEAMIPVSIARESALQAHFSDTNNPHNVTAEQVGGAAADIAALQAAVATLQQQVLALQDLLQHFSRNGNDVYISGANLNVVSGSGSTDGAVNGLGNIVVGYNEADAGELRGGSHNLVVGNLHSYSSYGGLVAGFDNRVSAPSASVLGGHLNEAGGLAATVSGGEGNSADGAASAVAGGTMNNASGLLSVVGGGEMNSAGGDNAVVSGGFQSNADGMSSVVSGGLGLSTTQMYEYASPSVPQLDTLNALFQGVVTRDGDNLVFSGVNLKIVNGSGQTDTVNGLGNLIVGYDFPRFANSDKSGSHNLVVGDAHNYTSHSGIVAGNNNTISGEFASVTGGFMNTASGKYSSVSGGRSNWASGQESSVGGGTSNTASGLDSVVAGGGANTASGAGAAVVGGQSITADEAYASGSPMDAVFSGFVTRNGTELTFSGLNLHVVDGSGSTGGAVSGLGNLIVGYNETRGAGNVRSGSHNLVIGDRQNYGSYAGLVAGSDNAVTAPYASASGGLGNTAGQANSSVAAGRYITTGGN